MTNYIQNHDVLARRARQRRMSRNEQQVLALVDAMFEGHSRYLVLVLNLNYKSEYRDTVTLDDLRLDREHLFDNLRSNPILSGIEGYAWKIEEGRRGGGLHMHVVLFYNGEYQKDIYYADYIGQYWENVVTQGRGDYDSSNRRKHQNERGPYGDITGRVDRNDEKRERLCEFLVEYIAKEEQQVTSWDAAGIRRFGTSRL